MADRTKCVFVSFPCLLEVSFPCLPEDSERVEKVRFLATYEEQILAYRQTHTGNGPSEIPLRLSL